VITSDAPTAIFVGTTDKLNSRFVKTNIKRKMSEVARKR